MQDINWDLEWEIYTAKKEIENICEELFLFPNIKNIDCDSE